MTKIKFTKNRTVIGIMAIVLAIAIILIGMPLTSKMFSEKTDIIRVKKNITKGQLVTTQMIEKVSVGKYNLGDNFYKNTSEVVGKYALTDMYKYDYISKEKITSSLNSPEIMLSTLDGTQRAMSVTLNSFASSVSGKLNCGDIVSVIQIDKNGDTQVPPELKYVKIITCTTQQGKNLDGNKNSDKESKSSYTLNDDTDDTPATAILSVTDLQAEKLAELEKDNAVHLVLVCRADNNKAQEFLKTQEDFLSSDSIETEEK